jgi:heme A synthase
MNNTKKKMSRRTAALLWLLAVAVVIGVLIYIEQIAILYLLATISLVALLLIVAFSDLESIEREDMPGFADRVD